MKIERILGAGATIVFWLLQCIPVSAGSCDGLKYHQFDFFLGNWNVFDHSGKRFARDVVTREVDGCALLERWYGKKVQGAGFSAYDNSKGHWIQTFFITDGTCCSPVLPFGMECCFRATTPRNRARLNEIASSIAH